MYRVLVVDDDPVLRQSIKDALEFQEFIVDVACNGREAVNAVYREKFDLVVMDVNMPEMNGIDALIEIKKHNLAIIVLILTAYSNVQDAVKAVKEGAYNYLEKPISSENLVALIKRALKARSMVETMAFSAPTLSLGEKSGSEKFVGESGAMLKVFNLIEKLAKVNTPVLIRGESGTGKELVAKAIHFNGPRKDEKFVTVNCAAIPETLIESELFGHEKGAFTGAIERKIGKFQYASGGTLFLDEIGDISPSMQVKLLRVLQEKNFTPVGANREITCDVRVIAASNKHFEEMIKAGTFREDLFYRLNVLPVYLPPLRERTSDIPHLLNHYVNYFNNLHDLHIKGIREETLKLLMAHRWPGNIRELRNVLEHSFIIESSDYITPSSLPDILQPKSAAASSSNTGSVQYDENRHGNDDSDDNDDNDDLEHYSDGKDVGNFIDVEGIRNSVLDEALSDKNSNDYKYSFGVVDGRLDFQVAKDLFEKQFIIEALKINSGRINQTALKANIPKKTLLRKIEKYGIVPREYARKIL
ncbi:MAG: sigma-54-dependent Fis family transcriptional regulator [Oligoflexia bacterium]|nr:sigma-54-dependent Fis family transcriptional regulator [Oligoflexia bacterium]